MSAGERPSLFINCKIVLYQNFLIQGLNHDVEELVQDKY